MVPIGIRRRARASVDRLVHRALAADELVGGLAEFGASRTGPLTERRPLPPKKVYRQLRLAIPEMADQIDWTNCPDVDPEDSGSQETPRWRNQDSNRESLSQRTRPQA